MGRWKFNRYIPLRKGEAKPGKHCFGKTPWQPLPDSKIPADDKMPNRLQTTDNVAGKVSAVR